MHWHERAFYSSTATAYSGTLMLVAKQPLGPVNHRLIVCEIVTAVNFRLLD